MCEKETKMNKDKVDQITLQCAHNLFKTFGNNVIAPIFLGGYFFKRGNFLDLIVCEKYENSSMFVSKE